MLARNETIFKWLLYALATLLCVLVQGLVLQRVSIWGVIPFLYPLRPAVLATCEGPTAGTVYSLAVGVLCDSLLPGPIPCFYTLTLPLVGLCASLLAQSVLPAGFLCSAAASVMAFAATGLFHCLLLFFQGKAAWSAGFSTMARELAVTLPMSIPMTVLYRAVYRKTHLDD